MIKTVFAFLTIFTPVFAYGIYRSRICSWKITVSSVFAACIGAILGAIIPRPILGIRLISNNIHFYLLFGAMAIVVFGYKLGYNETYRILPISMITVFIASDWFEIPVFLYGALGARIYVNWTGHVWDHIHRVYVLASIYLLSKLGKFERTSLTIPFILAGFLFSMLILNPGFVLTVGYPASNRIEPIVRSVILFFSILIVFDMLK